MLFQNPTIANSRCLLQAGVPEFGAKMARCGAVWGIVADQMPTAWHGGFPEDLPTSSPLFASNIKIPGPFSFVLRRGGIQYSQA